MIPRLYTVVCIAALFLGPFMLTAQSVAMRAPAYPLVTVDPYFSIWSNVDTLNTDDTRHWTLRPYPLYAYLRVDGVVYRLMGGKETAGHATAVQTSLQISATASTYTFTCGGIIAEMQFLAPLLPDQPEVLSRPVNYLTLEVRSGDRRAHAVEWMVAASSHIGIDLEGQESEWGMGQSGPLQWLRSGSTAQRILGKKGDDVRIDWGYFYLASADKVTRFAGSKDNALKSFLEKGLLEMPRMASPTQQISKKTYCLALSGNWGQVGNQALSSRVLLAYDDIHAIHYFGDKLNAWWRRDGQIGFEDMLREASSSYEPIRESCLKFDRALYRMARKAGGDPYAALCLLAYRQCMAAHKLVASSDGRPYFFSKENFSNGSIGTVDVTYPSSPLFLVLNPFYLKAMLEPVFDYCESGRWEKKIAPHDLGTYPSANGQTYPHDMPVEECGNMILLTAAYCAAAEDYAFARQHWALLSQWVQFLEKDGLDPVDQLCTDDFAGKLARNANLSLKAILGIAAFAQMAEKTGDAAVASTYRAMAVDYANRWQQMADDGDHTVLAFGQPGTWSLKYNLIWDKIFGFDLFPESLYAREVSFYKKKQLPYGVPLDSRKTYTKSDWLLWAASLADNRDDFQALMAPVYRYISETPSRVPLGDWHETTDGKHLGMQARSVVGAYYIRLLKPFK